MHDWPNYFLFIIYFYIFTIQIFTFVYIVHNIINRPGVAGALL